MSDLVGYGMAQKNAVVQTSNSCALLFRMDEDCYVRIIFGRQRRITELLALQRQLGFEDPNR
jgi:hypothetical protein